MSPNRCSKLIARPSRSGAAPLSGEGRDGGSHVGEGGDDGDAGDAIAQVRASGFLLSMVSPVFHRWHHAVAPQDKNFASTFPVWDLMFGTFYMPQGQVPQEYGIDATSAPVPEGLLPQLIYPLKA